MPSACARWGRICGRRCSLNATASNLNQLTAHLNAGNLRDPPGAAPLRDVLTTLTAEVRLLRLVLLGVAPEEREDAP